MDLEQNTSQLEESSFYPEDRKLNEISRSFKVFDLIEEIKESFVEKLKRKGLDEEDFVDFRLGTMKTLNGLTVRLSIDEFLRESYIGLLHVLLCLQSDGSLSDTSKQLLPQIDNSLSIIRHVLQERGTVIPNLDSKAKLYRKNTLDHLSALTDTYLSDKPGYQVPKSYRDLIKDFEVVNEIAQSLRDLQDKIEELRRKQRQASESVIHRKEENLSLCAEMEEIIDLSPLFANSDVEQFTRKS